MRRVAVVRALPGLGDFLCAVPALRALRAALPAAQITLIGLPATQTLAACFPRYIDEFLEFPGYPGIPERDVESRRLGAFLDDLRARGLDLAVQLHGSGLRMNGFVGSLGARQQAGLYPADGMRPADGWWAPYPESMPEVRRCLLALQTAGIPACGEQLEFPLLPTDRAALRALPETNALRAGGYVCVHPGASVPERRWPAERFATVARALSMRGLTMVLTGAAEERPLADAVAALANVPLVNLAGRTDLDALATLLEGARLLLCNDTGVSHLADALRTPSVVLFSGSDPVRWAPLDRTRHITLGSPGGTAPAAGDVLAQVLRLLDEDGDDAR